MDAISMDLNPPRFVRRHKKPLIHLHRSPSRVWPLPALNGREPVVLGHVVAGHRDEDHHGIEVAYPRVNETDAATTCPINTPNGTATHIMPAMTPALAVDDGVIVFAGTLGHAYGVTIYHGGGWASHYANLQALCAIRTDLYRPREQNVRAGESIGIVGGPTLDAFRRLYFEWWRDVKPTDPRPYLAGWPIVQHFNHFTPEPPSTTQEGA